MCRVKGRLDEDFWIATLPKFRTRAAGQKERPKVIGGFLPQVRWPNQTRWHEQNTAAAAHIKHRHEHSRLDPQQSQKLSLGILRKRVTSCLLHKWVNSEANNSKKLRETWFWLRVCVCSWLDHSAVDTQLHQSWSDHCHANRDDHHRITALSVRKQQSPHRKAQNHLISMANWSVFFQSRCFDRTCKWSSWDDTKNRCAPEIKPIFLPLNQRLTARLQQKQSK